MSSLREKPALPPVRTSILVRAVRQYVLFAVFIVAAMTLVSFLVARSLLEQRVLAQLSSVVSAKEDFIEQSLQSDREYTALLALRPELQAVLAGEAGVPTLERMLGEMRAEHVPALGMAVYTLGGERVAGTVIALPEQISVTKQTILNPVVDEDGWQSHEVYSPVRSSNGVGLGVVAVRYDSLPLLDTLFAESGLGDTGEILLGMEKDGDVLLFRSRQHTQGKNVLLIGDIKEQYFFGTPIARAVQGEEGLHRAENYAGKDVYTAYRILPSLGWGLVVSAERAETLHGIQSLAVLLGVIGALFSLGAGFIAYLLARHFTEPILRLSKKVTKLGPDHWGFRRSVRTGDELEVLDSVVADLTKRLQRTYNHLEEEVADRTKELKEQYLKDRAILESIELGVIAVDKKNVIVDVNTAAAAFLKGAADDFVGSDLFEVARFRRGRGVHTDMEKELVTLFKKGKSFRADNNAHMTLPRSDGSQLPISMVATPIMDKNNFLGGVVVFQDMTEERRIDYVKSEFISLASHQLRTPISTIQWYLELFAGEKKSTLSSVQLESLKEMQVATQRMSNLVETLLHTARLEGGAIAPKKDTVDLGALVADIASELRPIAKDAGIACAIRVPQKKVYASVDPILLHIVLQNLFSNAVRYSRPRSEVAVQLIDQPSQVKISVIDRGIGIPKDEQKRIFQRLFRGQKAIQMQTDGNGLGLYVSKMVVEIMGGTISFKSTENEGTTFAVVFPKSLRTRKTKHSKAS